MNLFILGEYETKFFDSHNEKFSFKQNRSYEHLCF